MLEKPQTGPLVILAALLVAGCTGLQSETGAEPEAAEAITMAPGTTAHVLLNASAAPAAASAAAATSPLAVEDDAGLTVQVPQTAHDNGSGLAFIWVEIQVPDDVAPGEYQVILTEPEETRRVMVPVTVEEVPEPLGEGATAVVDLTMRTSNGTVTATTETHVHDSPVPKADGYQPPQGEPQPIPISPQQLPPEILGPLAATGVGHSLTIEMPEFFGPEHMEQEQPRDEQITRNETMQRYLELPRAQAQQGGYIDEDTSEGDTLPLGGPVPYIVETLNETILRAELDVEEGETVQLHAAWPDATAVEEIGAEQVILRTEPPFDEGETFTWNPSWPNATQVSAFDDQTITLLHTPAEGLSYTQNTQQGPIETTVIAVGENNITVSQQNPHPMAGQTIFIHLTITGIQEAQQQPPQISVG